jgi:hypothetical protein
METSKVAFRPSREVTSTVVEGREASPQEVTTAVATAPVAEGEGLAVLPYPLSFGPR